MGFGDILEEWESRNSLGQYSNKKKISSKKENCDTDALDIVKDTDAKIVEKKSLKKHPVDVWINRYGVVDKDDLHEKNQNKHVSPKKLPIEDFIDLHGLSRDEAWRQLSSFIEVCRRRGLKKVLIIHGKGNHSNQNPVLVNLVRGFVEHNKYIGASAYADKKDGGNGATWVIIKNN